MWLLHDMPVPSFMTIDSFMNKELNAKIEEIFLEINAQIFEHEKSIWNTYTLTEQSSRQTPTNTVGCGRRAVKRTVKRHLER